jgi:succinate dehydrogenase/fumarate reductase-like Fe-S protein
MPERTIKIEIKRQSGPDAAAHWDKFEIPYRPGMNVISSMMEIAYRLRLQLPRRDLRFLRHAHQRQGEDGLLRAHR